MERRFRHEPSFRGRPGREQHYQLFQIFCVDSFASSFATFDSASARLRLFWHVTFIMIHFVDHAIMRMLNTAALLVNDISTIRFAAMVFLLLGPLTGI